MHGPIRLLLLLALFLVRSTEGGGVMVDTEYFKITLADNKRCGQGTLHVPTMGVVADVEGCRDPWDVSGKLSQPVEVKGVTLQAATVHVRQVGSGWLGEVNGTSLVGSEGQANASASFTGTGVENVELWGQLQLGAINATFRLKAAGGVLEGDADMTASFSNNTKIPAFRGGLRLHSGHWAITAQSSHFSLWGVNVEKMQLMLEGDRVSVPGKLLWAGTVSAAAVLPDAESAVKLSGTMHRSRLSGLQGKVSLRHGGSSFDGILTIHASSSCIPDEAAGEFTVEGVGGRFTGVLTYDRCGAGQFGGVAYSLAARATQVDAFQGVALQGAQVEVRGRVENILSSGQPVLEWEGELTGSLEVLGMHVEARGAFDDGLLEDVLMNMSYANAYINITGEVRYSAQQCSPFNHGAVTAIINVGTGISVEAELAQADGCGADGKPVWELKGPVVHHPPVVIGGVTVPASVATRHRNAALLDSSTLPLPAFDVLGMHISDTTVNLVHENGGWKGHLNGTVSIAGNVLSAAVSATASGDVEMVAVAGDFSFAGMQGTVDLEVRDQVLSGKGTFDFAGTNTALANFEASLRHELHGGAWEVEATGIEIEVWGLEVKGAALQLLKLSNQSGWSGSIAGTASMGGGTAVVEVEIVDGHFGALVGHLQVGGAGDAVHFSGSVQVKQGPSENCPDVTAVGTLKLSAPQAEFNATLQHMPCAVLPGRTVLAVSGVSAGTIPFGSGFALDGISVSAVCERAAQGDSGCEWKGTVSGAAAMLTGSASAEAKFEGGKLEEVAADVEYDTEQLRIGGRVVWAAGTGCGAGSVAVSAPQIGVEGKGNLTSPGCGADGWSLEMQVRQSVAAHGVQLRDASLALTTATDEPRWTGELTGTLSVGQSSLEASLAFDTSSPPAFYVAVEGTVAVAPVVARLSGNVSQGVLHAAADIDVSLSNAVVPTFTATVMHAFNVTGSDEQWRVSGDLEAWEARGVVMDAGHVLLSASADDSSLLVWNGAISGSLTVPNAFTASLEAEVTDSALGPLSGIVSVHRPGASFLGQVYIAAGGCSLQADGALQLQKVAFNASFTYSQRCGNRTDGEIFRFDGTTAAAGEILPGLTLRQAAVTLVGTDEGLEGEVTGTAQLFGGTSRVAAVFADGSVTRAEVSTRFILANGMLSGGLAFQYHEGCDDVSGTMNGTIRMRSKQDLSFTGVLRYSPCTGEMSVNATHHGGWNGFGILRKIESVTVSLQADGHGGTATKQLAQRRWVGSLTAEVGAWQGSVRFDSTDPDGVPAVVVRYEDHILEMTLAADGNCSGSGVAILNNLPNNMVPIEADVTAEIGCDPVNAWMVSGTADGWSIPLVGKPLSLGRVHVSLTKRAGDDEPIALLLTASWGGFTVTVAADSLLSTFDINGVYDAAATLSADSAAAALAGGQTPFAAGLGNGVDLFDKIKGCELSEVRLAISLEDASVTMAAEGAVLGAEFTVSLAVARRDGAWRFGLRLDAASEGVQGLPGVLGTVTDMLAPARLSFSIGTADFEAGAVGYEQGFVLSVHLGSGSPSLQKALASSPAELQQQMEANGTSTGVVLRAQIKSVTEMTISLALAGNVRLGRSSAYLTKVAMAFRLGSGPPEFGFLVGMRFTVGKGSSKKVLGVSGWLGVDLSGSVTIEVDASMVPDTWENPLGVKGTAVLFPLSFRATMSPALVPTAFGFRAGAEIAGCTSRITFGVDLTDFRNSAFAVTEMRSLSVTRVLTDVVRCKRCDDGLAGVLSDISIGYSTASFSPDLTTPATLTFADGAAVIPAGINIGVQKLNLWNVLVVKEGRLNVTAAGVEAVLKAEKVKWGPVTLTSVHNADEGPSFELALTSDRKVLMVDGKASVFGQSVSVLLDIREGKRTAFFELKMAGLVSLSASLESVGKPGEKGFRNTVTGSLSTAGFGEAISQATEFLHKLSAAAQAELDKALEKLRKARGALQDKRDSLASKERKVLGDVQRASSAVSRFRSEAARKNSQCSSYKSRCSWRRPRYCAKYAWCKTGYAAIQAKKIAADVYYKTAKAAVKAFYRILDKGLAILQKGVSLAEGAISKAKSVVGAFDRIVEKAGGALKKALIIHHVTVKTELSAQNRVAYFEGDITVLGRRHQFSFNTPLSPKGIISAIRDFFRSKMRISFGSKIPQLKN